MWLFPTSPNPGSFYISLCHDLSVWGKGLAYLWENPIFNLGKKAPHHGFEGGPVASTPSSCAAATSLSSHCLLSVTDSFPFFCSPTTATTAEWLGRAKATRCSLPWARACQELECVWLSTLDSSPHPLLYYHYLPPCSSGVGGECKATLWQLDSRHGKL